MPPRLYHRAMATNLGPDERDMDLIDGSWEQDYYSSRRRRRDWNSIGIGIAILVVLGLLLPGVLVLFS